MKAVTVVVVDEFHWNSPPMALVDGNQAVEALPEGFPRSVFGD
jgi:hypothetical protein